MDWWTMMKSSFSWDCWKHLASLVILFPSPSEGHPDYFRFRRMHEVPMSMVPMVLNGSSLWRSLDCLSWSLHIRNPHFGTMELKNALKAIGIANEVRNVTFPNATGYNTALVVRNVSFFWHGYHPNEPICPVLFKKSPLSSPEKHEVNLPSEQRDLLFNFHGRHPGFGPSYYKDNVVRGKIIDIFTGLAGCLWFNNLCVSQQKTNLDFMNPWRPRVARSTDMIHLLEIPEMMMYIFDHNLYLRIHSKILQLTSSRSSWCQCGWICGGLFWDHGSLGRMQLATWHVSPSLGCEKLMSRNFMMIWLFLFQHELVIYRFGYILLDPQEQVW